MKKQLLHASIARKFIYITFIVTACNSKHPLNENNISSDFSNKIEVPKNSNDSIFYNFLNCLNNSKSTQVIWFETHPIVLDDPLPDGEIPLPTDDGYGNLGYLNDPLKIKQFIDSLPHLLGHPNSIMSVKDGSNNHLIFVCNNDTLVAYTWDLGKNQIHIKSTPKNNEKPYFIHEFRNINFNKLYELLEKIKIKK